MRTVHSTQRSTVRMRSRNIISQGFYWMYKLTGLTGVSQVIT